MWASLVLASSWLAVSAGEGLLLRSSAPQPQPPFQSVWYGSSLPAVNLSTSTQPGVGEVLRWTAPQHFSAIFTTLPKPLPLAAAGQSVRLSMRWRSSGEENCPAKCYTGGRYCQAEECQKTKCQSTTVSCLAGTGDFRIALLDSSSAAGGITAADWCPAGVGYKDMTKCVTGPPFDGMKGYDFRIYPHLTTEAKHEPGQVPNSIYRKSSSNLFGKHPRLGEWGGFGTPLGVWTTLDLVITRLDPRGRGGNASFSVAMTMNNVTQQGADSLLPSDPTLVKQIDSVAIGYPNGRHYTYVDLAGVAVQ